MANTIRQTLKLKQQIMKHENEFVRSHVYLIDFIISNIKSIRKHIKYCLIFMILNLMLSIMFWLVDKSYIFMFNGLSALFLSFLLARAMTIHRMIKQDLITVINNIIYLIKDKNYDRFKF